MSNATITSDDITTIARLARLDIDSSQASNYADDLSKILGMMDILAEVNTDDVAPLTNVHDMTQPLREDVVTGEIDRERNQSIAPNVQDGLYLVPQVIK